MLLALCFLYFLYRKSVVKRAAVREPHAAELQRGSQPESQAAETETQLQKATANFAWGLFFLSFICFPAVVHVSLSANNCIKFVDHNLGGYVMAFDDTLRCDDVLPWRVVAWLVTIGMGCGVPVCFGGVLYHQAHLFAKGPHIDAKNRAMVQRVAQEFSESEEAVDDVVRDIFFGRRFAFLLDGFDARWYYFEAIDFTRKLFIIGLLTLADQGTMQQILCVAAAWFVFFLVM